MRRLGSAIAGFLVGLALASSPAFAQDRSERGGTPGVFDFYVLALSWSPAFCAGRGAERGSPQCDAGKRLGFVVHGLWPQYDRGYPSACSNVGAPRYAVEEGGSVYPDPGLARHEWRLHGTCSGLAPTEYFRAVRAARDLVTIPDPLAAMEKDGETSPASVERAFGAVNRGLRPDMMSVTCQRGALQEVRVCMTKDLRGFRPCPEVDRNACRFGPIRVTAPR